MIIIRASTHQGSPKFRGIGRQCVAMSTEAIRTAQKVSPRKWDPYLLDTILENGDKLYIALNEKNPQLKYLTFTDVNAGLSDMTISESLYGTLANSNDIRRVFGKFV